MRIAGISIPDNKRIDIALSEIHGIGPARARALLKEASVDTTKKTKDVTDDEEARIRDVIESSYTIEGDLRRQVSGNIKRLQDIRAYRGTRHTKRLPSRGQRTKTNSRTRRGNIRKTMGTGRRKVEKK